MSHLALFALDPSFDIDLAIHFFKERIHLTGDALIRRFS